MTHTIYIHIDEELTPEQLQELHETIGGLSFVTDVEVNSRLPHDLLVEYEPQRGMPMPIINQLNRMGLHADVTSC
ncbi:hypothetical protein [Thiohalobacter thiocyanaticus]|uniref:Uncharacterized protein n=1 Tax=Thiohalobacter thiocyanaticus TaxID=585455 RepID=A0A426QKM3_9GAMM|nr:hypothetical protein [Thiohalobacter thiocyanaticus]RRQ22290.1 hypothetical protein D6C00_10235 [Thiohalobacter thiocyanaticus]